MIVLFGIIGAFLSFTLAITLLPLLIELLLFVGTFAFGIFCIGCFLKLLGVF